MGGAAAGNRLRPGQSNWRMSALPRSCRTRSPLHNATELNAADGLVPWSRVRALPPLLTRNTAPGEPLGAVGVAAASRNR